MKQSRRETQYTEPGTDNREKMFQYDNYSEPLPVRGEGEILIPDYGVLGANTGLDLLYGKRHTTGFIAPDSYAHHALEANGGNRAAIGIPEHYELVPGFNASGQKVFVLYAENITFTQEKGGGFRSINIRDLP